MGMAILDSAGSAYTVTPMSVTAASATFQVRKITTLPSGLVVISALSNYNTAPAAPAGLTLYVSAHA